jgi:hypothetical protein
MTNFIERGCVTAAGLHLSHSYSAIHPAAGAVAAAAEKHKIVSNFHDNARAMKWKRMIL